MLLCTQVTSVHSRPVMQSPRICTQVLIWYQSSSARTPNHGVPYCFSPNTLSESSRLGGGFGDHDVGVAATSPLPGEAELPLETRVKLEFQKTQELSGHRDVVQRSNGKGELKVNSYELTASIGSDTDDDVIFVSVVPITKAQAPGQLTPELILGEDSQKTLASCSSLLSDRHGKLDAADVVSGPTKPLAHSAPHAEKPQGSAAISPHKATSEDAALLRSSSPSKETTPARGHHRESAENICRQGEHPFTSTTKHDSTEDHHPRTFTILHADAFSLEDSAYLGYDV